MQIVTELKSGQELASSAVFPSYIKPDWWTWRGNSNMKELALILWNKFLTSHQVLKRCCASEMERIWFCWKFQQESISLRIYHRRPVALIPV